MVEGKIADICAPTLAGFKCGSLFRTEESLEALNDSLNEVNAELNPLGVTVEAFVPSGCGTLVYVYRNDLLQRIASDERALRLLDELGYDTTSTSVIVGQLKERVESAGCVPHEIGFFLGYPYEDVLGFMNDKGRCPKCCGCWKVYGSVERANRMFASIHRCREDYRARFMSGTSLVELTVSM